jgi:uncharacterized protein YjbI with pentapeptide repeats
MTKSIQIKHCLTGDILFEGDSGMTMKATLEKAVAAKTDLHGADLYGANLLGANLFGADMRGADLSCANLIGTSLVGVNLSGASLHETDLHNADLRGADLHSANLKGVNLKGVNLSGINLSSAYLGSRKLIGKRPFLTIGPIGSRCDYMQAWITDTGVMVQTGCFFDTRDKFELALNAEHGDNDYGQEYRAALALIDKHAELWTPAVGAAVVP